MKVWPARWHKWSGYDVSGCLESCPNSDERSDVVQLGRCHVDRYVEVHVGEGPTCVTEFF